MIVRRGGVEKLIMAKNLLTRRTEVDIRVSPHCESYGEKGSLFWDS
jgi:hypothetical protein